MSAEAGSTPEGAQTALYEPDRDPEGAGWVVWRLEQSSRFNAQFGEIRTLRDGDRATVRMQPHDGLTNLFGSLHGGAVMGFVDIAMFLGTRALGSRSAPGGLTLDCNVQFVGSADVRRPIDVIVQIARETGQFLFVRGTVEQEGDMVASYLGMLRKPRR